MWNQVLEIKGSTSLASIELSWEEQISLSSFAGCLLSSPGSPWSAHRTNPQGWFPCLKGWLLISECLSPFMWLVMMPTLSVCKLRCFCPKLQWRGIQFSSLPAILYILRAFWGRVWGFYCSLMHPQGTTYSQSACATWDVSFYTPHPKE